MYVGLEGGGIPANDVHSSELNRQRVGRGEKYIEPLSLSNANLSISDYI